jgi:hypothetical protein
VGCANRRAQDSADRADRADRVVELSAWVARVRPAADARLVQRAPRWGAARVARFGRAASRSVASAACRAAGVTPASGGDGTSEVGAAVIVGGSEQRRRTGVTHFRSGNVTRLAHLPPPFFM